MLELNLEVCRTIAVQYGLPLQFVVKEFHIFEVLGQISRLTAPSRRFVFKGGTALNKVYFEKLQRFSEDLDFDLAVEDLKEVRSFCEWLAGEIEGYEISEFRKVKGTLQFYCNYETPLGGKDHIRVDVALKRIISAKPVLLKQAFSFYTHGSVTGFYVYSLEDLVARKMHALRTRTEGKDVYDVSNALPLCASLSASVKKMLESEERDETPEEFIRKTILAVKRTDPRKLRNLTNPFIPVSSRPKDWSELKNDLILKLEQLFQK